MLTMTAMMKFYYRHAVELPNLSFQNIQNSVPLQIVASNLKKDLIASLIIDICMLKVGSVKFYY